MGALSRRRHPRETRCIIKFDAWHTADSVLEHHGRGELVHYDELPEAIWNRVAPLFGITLNGEEQTRMIESTSRDAKRPERKFVDDRAAKRSEADESIEAAINRWLIDTYNRIEERRRTAAIV